MKKLAREARLGMTDAGFELQQRMMKTPEEALLRRVHNEYLDGRRTVAQIAQDLDLQEWVPDERLKSMKSRTERTKFTAASLSDSAADPTKIESHESPNLSGDESDRTASVAADYLAEHEDPKISTKIGEVIQPSSKVIVHTATGPVSRRHHMSRRGRGGYGGGSGLKGATWEHDPSIQLESKPSDLFPRHPNLKKPAPLTEKEQRQIQSYKSLQEQIHRGPLYTQPTKRDPDSQTKTFSEEQFNAQYGSNSKADMDPFTGVETYSMRYQPKKNILPKLSDRPFNKELFPEELWSTLEGEEGAEVRKHINRITKKKALMLGASQGSNNTSEKTKIILEKIKNATGAGEEGEGEMEDPDDDMEQEPEDDDFEGDEDEMAGDYDGEQYFENGEDDEEDGGDVGADDY